MSLYRTICADPPWRYDEQGTRTGGGHGSKAGAGKHYDLLSLEEIIALDVPAEEQAHLWLWGTNALLDLAYVVARAWGFRPTTLVTWCKPGPGVGAYLRNNTEHCLFATRGDPLTPEKKPLSTWYQWPRASHSEKPDAFYDLVEQVSPGPYLELFARRARFGWDYAGDESLQTVELAS